MRRKFPTGSSIWWHSPPHQSRPSPANRSDAALAHRRDVSEISDRSVCRREERPNSQPGPPAATPIDQLRQQRCEVEPSPARKPVRGCSLGRAELLPPAFAMHLLMSLWRRGQSDSPASRRDLVHRTGHWALGTGHWALGTGHWALGTIALPHSRTFRETSGSAETLDLAASSAYRAPRSPPAGTNLHKPRAPPSQHLRSARGRARASPSYAITCGRRAFQRAGRRSTPAPPARHPPPVRTACPPDAFAPWRSPWPSSP
jgi:hypothetical protein